MLIDTFVMLSYLSKTRFFTSSFKDQATASANWLPMSRSQIPYPRPGQCPNDSRKSKRFTVVPANHSETSSNIKYFPDNSGESRLNFIKHHALMDSAVPSYLQNKYPLYVKTSLGERLTAITVDSVVKIHQDKDDTERHHYDVIFVGTTTGRVLKLVDVASHNQPHTTWRQDTKSTNTKENTTARPIPVLIESIQIFEFNVPIRDVMVDKATSKLIVLSDNEVTSYRRFSICLITY